MAKTKTTFFVKIVERNFRNGLGSAIPAMSGIL